MVLCAYKSDKDVEIDNKKVYVGSSKELSVKADILQEDGWYLIYLYDISGENELGSVNPIVKYTGNGMIYYYLPKEIVDCFNVFTKCIETEVCNVIEPVVIVKEEGAGKFSLKYKKEEWVEKLIYLPDILSVMYRKVSEYVESLGFLGIDRAIISVGKLGHFDEVVVWSNTPRKGKAIISD